MHLDLRIRENTILSEIEENNYDVLRRILFYYAHEHCEVSDVQGMNEIIAIIFYIFSMFCLK